MWSRRVLAHSPAACVSARLRRARRLSIAALAFAAKIHPTYLPGIERGIRNPTWAKLRSVAQALDAAVSLVVQEAETEAKLAKIDAEVRAEVVRRMAA